MRQLSWSGVLPSWFVLVYVLYGMNEYIRSQRWLYEYVELNFVPIMPDSPHTIAHERASAMQRESSKAAAEEEGR